MDDFMATTKGLLVFFAVVAATVVFCELLLKYYKGEEYVPPKDRTFYKNLKKGGKQDADRPRA